MRASVEVIYSASPEPRVQTLPLGLPASSQSAIKQQLLLLQLSLLPLGHALTPTPTQLSQKDSALSKAQSAVTSRALISQK